MPGADRNLQRPTNTGQVTEVVGFGNDALECETKSSEFNEINCVPKAPLSRDRWRKIASTLTEGSGSPRPGGNINGWSLGPFLGSRPPRASRESASSGLLLWQAERNHLPIFFRRYPLRCLFFEAVRYEEFNHLRHKSPHL